MSTTKQDVHPFKSEKARDEYLAFYARQASTWPVECEERTIATAEGDTFVRVSGPADAPPVVLMPAGRTPSTCWTPMVAQLAERYRVYALDAIYDDGRSVNRIPIKTIEDATTWLDHVLDALGLREDVTLMGISFGAWLSAEYELRHPERLRKVVWLSPVGVVLPMSGEFLARSMACLIPAEATFRWVTRWIMPDAALRKPEFFDAAIEEMALSERCFKFRMWPGGGPRKLTDDELAGLTVPTLYLVGENERICSDPMVALERVKTLAPHIATAMVPGGGHDVLWVETDAVSDRVLEFLTTE